MTSIRAIFLTVLCAALVVCSETAFTPHNLHWIPESKTSFTILKKDEIFSGMHSLRERFKRINPHGELVVFDQNCPAHDHCHGIIATAVDGGTPGHLVVAPELKVSSYAPSSWWWQKMLKRAISPNTKVMLLPVSSHILLEMRSVVEHHDVIFIVSAGNTDEAGPNTHRRDLYTEEHPLWNRVDVVWEWNGYAQRFWARALKLFGIETSFSLQSTLDTLNTGKAVLATWASRDEDGKIVPYGQAVRCDDALYSCFTLVLPPHLRKGDPVGTSYATPVLGAVLHYLAQIFRTPEEAVSTLKVCTIDIGEPGVDREFGLGIPDLNCPLIKQREAEVFANKGTLAFFLKNSLW